MAVKQRQSQKQNVNVNINLGEKKKKRKPRKRKTGKKEVKRQTQIIPAFNPPPIINFPPGFNQQPAINLPPPPIAQKQYSVFPEGETATQLNLLSNVPVPLRVEGSPLKAKAKEPKPEAYKVINEPFKAPEEEYQLIEPQPSAAPPPFVEPAPELAVVGGEAQQFFPDQPEGYTALTERYKPAEFPQEPPSPTASTISGFTADPTGILSPSFYNVAGLGLSKVSQSLPLPPIGLSAQPLTSSGLTAYTQPSNFPPEYLFEEGAAEKPKKKKGLASVVVGELPAPEPEKKKAGRPKGASNKPKYETTVPAGQTQFAVPVKETLAFPAESFYSAPLAEQPLAQFLGTEKPFSTEPEKVSGGLERRRRETALTPAEQKETAYNLAPGPPEKISGRLERRRETALTPAEQTLLSNPLGNQPPLFA